MFRSARVAAAVLAAAAVVPGCADLSRPTAPGEPNTSPPSTAAPGDVAPGGWIEVVDAGTGVRAALSGPARRQTEPVPSSGREVHGVAYHAMDPSNQVEVVLHVSPLATEQRMSPQDAAAMTAHLVLGELAESRPHTIDGHRAVDARIVGWARNGGSGKGVLLIRVIDTPKFEVTMEANGDTERAALIQQVFERACAGLRLG